MTKINELAIETMATTQEEVIMVRKDSTVGEDTTKVASKTTHPEGQDVGSSIKIIT